MNSDLAATYASLILADEGLEITVRTIHHNDIASIRRTRQTERDRAEKGAFAAAAAAAATTASTIAAASASAPAAGKGSGNNAQQHHSRWRYGRRS